ncbi:MAG TPA: hypothetical protein P5533_02460 [Candidatus Cloacimonadota bacterium]|nr:hypothetical protein [Candidatus Cloacimonadota bacterium]
MNQSLCAAFYSVLNILMAPHKMQDYKRLLQQAQAQGYSFYTLAQFAALVRGQHPIAEPFMILRHDIDSDCKTALRIAGIENALGLRASYYFRLTTWKVNLIKEIAALGHEIGYHYEEIATEAKRLHLKDPEAIMAKLPGIRASFSENLKRLRKISGLPLAGSASHGDFANIKLDLTNRPLLADNSFREQLGLDYEAYDEDLRAAYGLHVSDKAYPILFHPFHPQNLIAERRSFLLLTHPRWWKLNLRPNLMEACKHIWEQILW